MIFDRNFDRQVLFEFLDKNSDQFSSSIHEQIMRSGNGDLFQYTKKLCEKGTIACEFGENGQLLGVIIGYTHDLPDNNSSYITYVLVDKESRGRGIYPKLMREYESYCKALGIDFMWLTTGKQNIVAQRAYEKAGFSLCGEYNDRTVRYEKALHK